MMESRFPPGTPVRVKQRVGLGRRAAEAEVVGTVEAWERQPTGSWYAHGRHGRLHLQRLKLKKPDGEISLLVVDDSAQIAGLERQAAEG